VSEALPPVAVLGAGSWGTALAVHLARLGAGASLWGRDPAFVKDVSERRENVRYLRGVSLPPAVRLTADAEEALESSGLIIVAVPSEFVEDVVRSVVDAIPGSAIVLSATKGLEPRRERRMSELLGELVPGRAVAVLSGPSFAREVALGQPTALVVASTNQEPADKLQRWLSSPAFRLYTNRDVVGVELAAALKNVIAIATGLADGLELGENARAALITRGLAEIVRLGVALGAQPGTFLGLAGLGDLVLTCTGSLSRNRALGREIGRGRTLGEVQTGTHMIAEGVRTVISALALARRARIEMPICQEVAAVLFEAKPVTEALRALLSREPRPEHDRPSGS
jgi:glycerol-3-phosphate dehydrogenase (NAD(P)+)